MNGLTLLVLIAAAAGLVVAFRAGVMRGRNARQDQPLPRFEPLTAARTPVDPTSPIHPPRENGLPASHESVSEPSSVDASLRAENAALRSKVAMMAAERVQLVAFADDRRMLHREIAAARGEAAHFRALVVDIENNTPPPLLTGPHTPDDLKLIVGIGPILERMLFQLGISTYGQIARMSDRDIDALDARLPEFPGRIRRDEWVTQARVLHQYKYGASERGGRSQVPIGPSPRDRAEPDSA